MPGLSPTPRHHALRPRLLPPLHHPGYRHRAGACAALRRQQVLFNFMAMLHKPNGAADQSFPCAPCACGQEKARCPLCRHEIKTSELVEFPPEELEEEGSLNSQNWGASSKVRCAY